MIAAFLRRREFCSGLLRIHTLWVVGVIAVIDYGIGNLRSAYKALVAVGADTKLIDDPRDLGHPDGIVIPGVGAFGAALNAFRSRGFEDKVRGLIEGGTPTLGICVGMQMLYESSSESKDSVGLGILDGKVERLSEGVRLPQMQWNRLEMTKFGSSALFEDVAEGSWVYFEHSYAAPVGANTTASCEYGGEFSAAVGVGNLFGVQFHPEKSSVVGLKILANFSKYCGSTSLTTGGSLWR